MQIHMRRQIDKFAYGAMLTVGITAILIGSGAHARVSHWVASSLSVPGEILASEDTVPAGTDNARARRLCPECGVVVSVRKIEIAGPGAKPASGAGLTTGNRDKARANSADGYHIMVRMIDGSSRVIEVADPARWRAGERVVVIAGAS